MNSSSYKIALDIHDHSSNVVIKTKRGDTSRTLYITLMDGRNPYIIDNDCYAVFTATKEDGNILFNHCAIIGNTISYAFTPQTTAKAGKLDCEIKVYGDEDKLLTSAGFSLLVEDTAYNEEIALRSETEVGALTHLVSEANKIVNEVGSKLANGEFIGPQGVSGVTAPAGGYFALEVDSATGNIYCVTEDTAKPPILTLDEDGGLYYEIKED